jgi:valyl-tRNA synthetase
MKTIDLWLLSELHKTVGEMEDYMEDYSFDDAIKSIRSFLWNIFADNYIEMVKSRLYEREDKSALYTIKFTLDVLSRLLAPFAPYISEEIYSKLYEERPQKSKICNVHLQDYPDRSEIPLDERSDERGEIVKDLVGSIRRYKSDLGIPLNKEINLIEIYDELCALEEEDLIDIEGTVAAKEVKINRKKPIFERKIIEIKPNMKKIGPEFRENSRLIAKKLKEMKPEGDKITIEIDGDKIELDSGYFEIRKEFITKSGETIKLLPIRDKMTVAVLI